MSSEAIRSTTTDIGVLACSSEDSQDWHVGFHLVMTAATTGAILISILGYLTCELSMDWSQAVPLLSVLMLLLAVAMQYRWRREERCFNTVMMAFWSIVITNTHFFPMYMAARTNVAMQDEWLASMDRAMGFEVPQVLELVAPYPGLRQFMLVIYSTLIPLMTVATILPALLNRMEHAKRFAYGCIIAASLSIPIFACLQAVGPWDYYGFPPAIDTLNQKGPMLAQLKTQSLFVIDVSNRDGLITFPSFHVILTCLAAAAIWTFRPLRPLVSLWATLIVVSTVVTGIHYAIDVVGGLAITLIAWAGARQALELEQRSMQRSA